MNRRRSRGLLVSTVVVTVLAVIFTTGAVSQWTTSAQERTLLQRGITTTATVVRSSYDPGGGDPNGWTTDTVRFQAAGHIQYVVVGHHDDDRPERASGTLPVVFDPQQPAVAMSAAELDGATPGLDFGLSVGFAVLVILGAGGLLLLALRSVRAPAVASQDQRALP